MSMRWTGCAVAGLLIFALALAKADPCKAIPDHGPAPADLQPGARLSGEVVRVLDGDSLCAAMGDSPNQWVEVRLADFYAPELSAPGGPAAPLYRGQPRPGSMATTMASPASPTARGDLVSARGSIWGRSPSHSHLALVAG